MLKRNLLYVGPINPLVSRLKSFSLASSLASTALAPVLIHYSPDHLSLSLKIGLASTILLTSYGTTALFHSLVGKYVYRLWQGPTELVFEKRSFFNRRRFIAVPEDELVAGGSIFSTWKWRPSHGHGQGKGKGEAFMVQFAEGSGVKSYEGEIVDKEAMTRLYNEISERR